MRERLYIVYGLASPETVVVGIASVYGILRSREVESGGEFVLGQGWGCQELMRWIVNSLPAENGVEVLARDSVWAAVAEDDCGRKPFL
jgi:hypothetical protein